MKKTYIIPVAKTINLATEESVLLSMSQQDGEGLKEGGLSNERESASSSIWGED